jgi:hypothetical protein
MHRVNGVLDVPKTGNNYPHHVSADPCQIGGDQFVCERIVS